MFGVVKIAALSAALAAALVTATETRPPAAASSKGDRLNAGSRDGPQPRSGPCGLGARPAACDGSVPAAESQAPADAGLLSEHAGAALARSRG